MLAGRGSIAGIDRDGDELMTDDGEPKGMFKHLWEAVGTPYQERNNWLMNRIVNREETGPGGFFLPTNDWRTIPKGVVPYGPPEHHECHIYDGIPIKFRILQGLAWIPMSWFLLTTFMNYNWYNVLGLIGSIALLVTIPVTGIYVQHRAYKKDLSEVEPPREVKQQLREEKPEVVDAEADGRSSFVPNFCYKCGRTLEPAWTFCKECGARVR